MQFDASRRASEPYGFTCELWTPTPLPLHDRHNESKINFLRSGPLTCLRGGRRIKVGAGRRGEVLFSPLILTGQDYRLNPLNCHAILAHERKLAVTVRLSL